LPIFAAHHQAQVNMIDTRMPVGAALMMGLQIGNLQGGIVFKTRRMPACPDQL